MSSFSRPTKAFLVVIPGLVLLLLFAGTGLPGDNSTKEPNASSKFMEEMQASLHRIEKELIGLRQGIPKETKLRLQDLENALNDPKKWPQTSDQTEKLRQDLDGMVETLPPLAAERILPQLIRLNWGVEALWNLRTHAHAKTIQFEEVQATIKEVLDRHPQGHFKELQKELGVRLSLLEPQLRQFQLKQLLERANLALEGKEDASAAYSSLDEFRGDKEVASILPKLRMKVLEKNGTERLESFEKTLKQSRSFADTRFRHVSALSVQEGLVRLIVDLHLEGGAPKEVISKAQELLKQCDKDLLTLVGEHQYENAKKLRRYQAWALGQIRKFDSPQGWYYDVTLPWVESELRKFQNAADDEEWWALREFPTIKKLLELKAGVDLSDMNGAILTAAKKKEIYAETWKAIGWKNKIHVEIAYHVTREAMVKFLLPIQPHLLDPPVAQLYQEAFSKGWKKLEGREDQLFVAQQSASVTKKTVEEVASSNP